MANTSIFAAFERFWQHVVVKLGDKANLDHTHDDLYYTEAEVDEKISEVSAPLSTLVGSDTDKSARDIALEVLTEQLVPETAQESLDTLEEIAAWIQEHPESFTALNAIVQNNSSSITDLDSRVDALEETTYVEYTDEEIDSLFVESSTEETA